MPRREAAPGLPQVSGPMPFSERVCFYTHHAHYQRSFLQKNSFSLWQTILLMEIMRLLVTSTVIKILFGTSLVPVTQISGGLFSAQLLPHTRQTIVWAHSSFTGLCVPGFLSTHLDRPRESEWQFLCFFHFSCMFVVSLGSFTKCEVQIPSPVSGLHNKFTIFWHQLCTTCSHPQIGLFS